MRWAGHVLTMRDEKHTQYFSWKTWRKVNTQKT